MAGPEYRYGDPLLPEHDPVLSSLDRFLQTHPGETETVLDSLAHNYAETWGRSGLLYDEQTARRKIASFDPANTHLLHAFQDGLIAQLHTAPVAASSVSDLVARYPTYESVERAAASRIWTPDFLVCFSLNCPPGQKVTVGGAPVSVPRHILESVPVPPGSRKLAFSFMTMTPYPFLADAEDMLHRYLYLLHADNTRLGGPVFMHEAFGAITVAFLPFARPDHSLAAGGSTIVAYPKNNRERAVFETIKANRRDAGEMPVKRVNHALVAADIRT